MDRPDLDDDETGPIRRITDEVSPSPARGASGTPGTPRPAARRTPPEGARRAADPARRRTDTGPQRVQRTDSGNRADTGPQRAARRGDTGPQRVPAGTKPRTAQQPEARTAKKAEPHLETGHGHGHGHGHGPAAPASKRVRLLLIWLLAPLALATVVGMIVLYPWGKPDPKSVVPQGTPVAANITATTPAPVSPRARSRSATRPTRAPSPA